VLQAQKTADKARARAQMKAAIGGVGGGCTQLSNKGTSQTFRVWLLSQAQKAADEARVRLKWKPQSLSNCF
jgi:hypothetical protein